ncbi:MULTISPECIES: DUF1543 domain-containing protein [Francisella]|uniref:DUF1543 domain-containing protein n=1 Tax=Francisella opportunistica TaxID=2016517 RepID=A0A345JS87_9GAMM|nr:MULTISPECIES: DUF1543 domain-containing protein [Francisella]APC91947.1 hypothetical protein BBG19_1215 [Francisella sp. MA067296]AXH30183.1 DUF1543 domain-containing protein [Francisella opportunistica]AXH31824.1 DUF1543 domain-containing protein [Francisella opportunistica]AXH33470.1 DUF1543 domain-containing protein [Francisella opportunistica]
MSQLFIVYLGGSAPKANIELHDIQFVIGDIIEDTYEQLRKNWFGSVKGLHLDSYKAVKGADGYKISLQDKPQVSDKKLYFVNLGGYVKSKLNELHEFGLFVATDKTQAKEKAKKSLLKNSLHQHKDNLMEVDDCLELSSINGKYIHLNPNDGKYDLKPDWFGYRVIG